MLLKLPQKHNGCANAPDCLTITVHGMSLANAAHQEHVAQWCASNWMHEVLLDGVLAGGALMDGSGLNSRALDGRRAQPCAGAGTSRCVQHRLGCGALLDSLLMACQKQETGLEGSPALSGATGAGRAQGCCCRILRLLIAGWEGLIPSRAGLLHHMV